LHGYAIDTGYDIWHPAATLLHLSSAGLDAELAMKKPLHIQVTHPEEGSAMIEFTLSAMVLFFVIFWAFELSMTMYTYVVIGEAAKEGVRYAIVHGTGSGSCSGPST